MDVFGGGKDFRCGGGGCFNARIVRYRIVAQCIGAVNATENGFGESRGGGLRWFVITSPFMGCIR